MLRILGISFSALILAFLVSASTTLSQDSSHSPSFPSSEDPRFGFGRAATEEEIARLDIDVMPDGTGLPDGSGTVAQGATLYSEKCAWCHGDDGTGGDDVLVGREPREGFPFGEERGIQKTIGNYWPYATTLYDYTFRAMPFDAPGTLTPDEVYSVVAFLLHENEVVGANAVMDRESLPKVAMPARDRFVDDDRRGGKELR